MKQGLGLEFFADAEVTRQDDADTAVSVNHQEEEGN